MKSVRVELVAVKKIKNLFDKRIFAIPQLQREFVWSSRKASDLLDSIYNNYPIGTILIWNAPKQSESLFRHDYISLPPFDNLHNKNIYLIIDGQQRLSVLFHCYEGDTIENSYYKEINFAKIYFNINSKNQSKFRFARRLDEENEVKVSDLLSTNWQNKFRSYPKYKKKSIQECRNKLLNYRIPIIFIDTKSLYEIKNTFIRINSSGTPLSSADRAFALATSFNLRHNIKAVQNQFEHGFKRINQLSLLMPIALIFGSNQVGKKGIETVISKIENDKNEVETFKKIWLALKNSYGLAIDYIVQNFDVINFDFLPSQSMITTLTCFFYFNHNRQPSPFQKEQLTRWFWYTSAGSRYSGRGYSKNILDDYEYFQKLGNRKNIKFKIQEKIPVNDINYADYSTKGSLSNAYFCLLASLIPKYLDGGGRIPLTKYSVRSNRKNKHHIFPKAHLISKGFNKKFYNSIANICFFVWKENIKVGANPPRKYLVDYRRRKYFLNVMKSHLIPYSKTEGLWDSNTKRSYKKFINNRTKLICQKFEKLAGVKLFEKVS